MHVISVPPKMQTFLSLKDVLRLDPDTSESSFMIHSTELFIHWVCENVRQQLFLNYFKFYKKTVSVTFHIPD